MRLGFDVGGTKTDAVAVSASGEILARVRRPTGWGAEALLATITDTARELTDAAADPIESVGIGMPGQVAPGTAVVTHAVNLGIDRLDLGEALGALLGAPVVAENDVKAATIGAAELRGDGASIAYLNLGTGVAAGFVTDGVLVRGARGGAGEVGHLSVDPHGPVCPCGQRGCIEAFCGGGAVSQRWGRPGALPVRDVFDAADAGNAAAERLRDDVVFGVAAAVRVIMLAVDVETVVIGGGVSALGDRMLTRVVTELEASAADSPFLRSLDLAHRVELIAPGSPAAALGAALIGARTTESKGIIHG